MPQPTSIDLSSEEFIRDPYPAYRQLQAAGAPQWLPHVDRTGTDGIWLFSHYRDVARILRDTQDISKDLSKLVPAGQVTAFDRMLLNLDPPEHTRLRAMIAPLFGVRRIANMEAEIADNVAALIDRIEPGKTVDFMTEFAVALPLGVVARIIGVPSRDMPRLKVWTDHLISGFDSARSSDEARSRLVTSLGELTRYLLDLIAADSAPEGSLIAHLSELRADLDEPDTEETLGLCILMVLAGHETTVNLLGSGLLCLLRFPDQAQRLRDDPALMNSAVDEMLRFESPLQRGTYRITQGRYKVGGVVLEPGQQVSAVIGAANRDPDEFPDPDVFDVGRRPNRHLAFGKGVHKCLGERLARAEARIAFGQLLARFGEIEMVDEAPCWQDKTLFRGLRSLAIQFRE